MAKTKSNAKSAPAKVGKSTLVLKIVAVVAVVVIAALLIIGGSVLWKHTDGFASGFKKMYVEINGTRYINSAEVRLPVNGTQRFNVGYLDGGKGFTYAIYANEDETFAYTVDELGYQFGGEYTDGFNIESDETGLTIATVNETPLTVLKRKYDEGAEIVAPEFDKGKMYFKLLITSYNGEQTVVIGLRFGYVDLDFGGDTGWIA